MKIPFVVAFFLFAQVTACCGVPPEIRGTWVVTGFDFAGVSAMSEAEAEEWIGRTMVIDDASSSLLGERVANCRVTVEYVDAERYFIEGFRCRPSELGISEARVRTYEIQDADCRIWCAPGSLLILTKKRVLTVWDGVFFVLQRKEPNQPPPTR